MLLKDLLVGVELKESLSESALNLEISHLTHNSKDCKEGSLFFALRGENSDGANYVSDVERLGALAIVVENPLKTSLIQVVTPNPRRAMAQIASNFYYNSHKDLKIIGITGTNGKTTTVRMIGDVLKSVGKRVATIGTLGIVIGEREISSSFTTPDPIELHRVFEICKLSGIEYVIMEVSAHALYFEKLYGVRFTVVALTNFTQDHLDFFGDMESYGKAKKLLFSKEFSAFQVLNADDSLGREIALETEVPFATYALKSPSDVFAIDYETSKGIKGIINCFDDVFEFSTPFIGEFNLYNALTAITILRLLSVGTESIINGFLRMQEVPGRFNILGKRKRVIIDYAHTPDGLSNLLNSARSITSGRLILVFGCGGNRDAKKRSIMGRIAGEKADFTVITSDNPRYEEPIQIMQEIERGLREVSLNYISIINRAHAINYAISTASAEDVVIIAGKGAEDYLEEKGVKHPFSDRMEALSVLESRNYD